LAALFLVGAVVIGLVGHLSEGGIVNRLFSGIGKFIRAAFVIALARGTTMSMNDAEITETVLNALQSLGFEDPSLLFGPMIFNSNKLLAFIAPSSSGNATLAMPIMTPLADFADPAVSRDIVGTARQSASRCVILYTPKSEIVMISLALAKVGYGRHLRLVWPLLVSFIVRICLSSRSSL
jgi:uncharacterized ion transporter superfamily protein YfcC